ncbi:MAG: chorismate synthase [candidate division WOR-3 bacterium]|nr:chorismate synthase [candidate division WOR-3 bacterium]
MIRILTAGESHGKGFSVIIDGLPAGLKIDLNFINDELKRRQSGKGRGERMGLESDYAELLAGVRMGRTIGSPVAFLLKNVDYRKEEYLVDTGNGKIFVPRPGHADLPGMLKFGFFDVKDVAERASARETVARVASGAVFKLFLKEFGISIGSKVLSVGRATDRTGMDRMVKYARRIGDTLGGVVEIYADNVCPGLGSYIQYDKRLDARIGMAMLSIPSVKGIEIGEAIKSSRSFGSRVHDAIFFSKKKGFYRMTNNAGGIEGGVSNGERIFVRLYAKPIPTLKKPLESVNIETKQKTLAPALRADVCVIEAIGVIGESMLAYVLADAFCEKFGGDSLADMKKNYQVYIKRIKNA